MHGQCVAAGPSLPPFAKQTIAYPASLLEGNWYFEGSSSFCCGKAKSGFPLQLQSGGLCSPGAVGRSQGGVEPWTTARTISMACRDSTPERVLGPRQPLDEPEERRAAVNWEAMCCEQRSKGQGMPQLKRGRSRWRPGQPGGSVRQVLPGLRALPFR